MVERLDSITQLQKIALEGEISNLLNKSLHDADLLYRIYYILKGTPEEFRALTIECIRNIVDIKTSELDKVICEISMPAIPIWLWIKKSIADISASLTLSEQASVGNANFNKRLAKKQIVKSAFVSFIRKAMFINPRAAIELCDEIINGNNNLDFLIDVCFTLRITLAKHLEAADVSTETKTAKKKRKKLEKKIMELLFDPADLLGFVSETKINEEAIRIENKFKESPEAINSFIVDLLNEGLSQPVEEHVYAVQKVFKGSGKSTTLQEFKTKKEAVEFIKEVREQFPDLEQTCTFVIVEWGKN